MSLCLRSKRIAVTTLALLLLAARCGNRDRASRIAGGLAQPSGDGDAHRPPVPRWGRVRRARPHVPRNARILTRRAIMKSHLSIVGRTGLFGLLAGGLLAGACDQWVN